MLMIYNTLSRKKEVFEPFDPPWVKMYVCGPTVYDSAHIGHAMSYIIFDMIRRYLEYRGYRVRHVQNFTDVEDKIILRSKHRGISWRQLTEQYIQEFLEEADTLNIKRAHAYPYASREIQGIIQVIKGLIESSYAYVVEGDVYFRVTADEDYGKLSNRQLEDMQAGARVAADLRKEYPMDFALWKAAMPDEPYWDSPWGPGRPGWHIECSAMSIRYLGNQIDVHGGGTDLIFPHHENEIAQSESFTNCQPFVKYWVHNGLLRLNYEKMSKSIGNFVTVKEMLENTDPNVPRLFVLSSHYRHPVTYTEESLAAAERGMDRLYAALYPPDDSNVQDKVVDNELREIAKETVQRFEEAMDNDFSTPATLSSLFILVKAINAARNITASPGFVEAQATLYELLSVLGFRLTTVKYRDKQVITDTAPLLDLLVLIRSKLREEKQWALADEVRDHMAALGIVLEDTATGTKWRTESG